MKAPKSDLKIREFCILHAIFKGRENVLSVKFAQICWVLGTYPLSITVEIRYTWRQEGANTPQGLIGWLWIGISDLYLASTRHPCDLDFKMSVHVQGPEFLDPTVTFSLRTSLCSVMCINLTTGKGRSNFPLRWEELKHFNTSAKRVSKTEFYCLYL